MNALEGALALLYPRRAACMGCDSQAGCDRDWLCAECRQALAKRWIGPRPMGEPALISGAAFAYHYEGPAGGMVRRLKYGGAHRLAIPMGAAMARAARGMRPMGADWVVPVPMHPRRERERGFNHAEKLARAVAAELDLPCALALGRVRDTPQQARLGAAERRENLKEAFAPILPLEGRRVLLVDDVYTTGATVHSCARALRDAGAKSVYVLCFALAEQDGGEGK